MQKKAFGIIHNQAVTCPGVEAYPSTVWRQILSSLDLCHTKLTGNLWNRWENLIIFSQKSLKTEIFLYGWEQNILITALFEHFKVWMERFKYF